MNANISGITGRTGRIGHRGVATSLFTEKDDQMGSVLARTLLETGQDIPDFMRLYLPDGVTRENVKFETESDFDPNEIAGNDPFGSGDMGTTNGAMGAEDTAMDAKATDDQCAGDPWGVDTPPTGGDNWDANVVAPKADVWAQPQPIDAAAW